MLYLKDKGNNWSTGHPEVEVGKYKGQKLSLVNDKSYLLWMAEKAKEKDLMFVHRMLNKRIKEIL